MNYWLCSDYHLGHKNIIKYCDRPFKSVDHMNWSIINRHNARVKEGDLVYFLGDFCFKNTSEEKGNGQNYKADYWINQLNGNIQFIKGNHDRNNSLKTLTVGSEIEFAGKRYWLTHRPEDFNKNFELNFCGHVHEKWQITIKEGVILVNMSCDVWDFYPQTIQHVLKIIKFKLKNLKKEDKDFQIVC